MELRIPYVNVFSATHIEPIEGGYTITAVDGKVSKVKQRDIIFVEHLNTSDGGQKLYRVSCIKRIAHTTEVNAPVVNSKLLPDGKVVKTAAGRTIHFNPHLVLAKE